MSVEMKDSGIAWLGKIPKHWNRISLKFLCQISTGDKDTVNKIDDGLYPFFVRSPQIERINSYTYDGEAILMAGDGVGAGRVFHYFCGKFDFHQRVYNLHNIQGAKGKFLYYYLSSNFYKLMDAGSAKSTVDSVRLPMLKDFPVVVPTIEEQSRIANFLDKKCTEIDELIALQDRMIAQRTTYKQAVITETVTKGLDPNVKMKDSGVEWIGEIPEHWDVCRVKNISNTNSGSTPKNISESDDSNIVWIRTTDINDDIVYDSSLHISLDEFKSASCPMLPVGTCLVAMYGGGGTIGKCGVIGEIATINQALCSMEVYENYYYLYLYNILRAVRKYWMKFAVGTRKDPNINQDIVNEMWIPYPSLSEQQSIANYLDQKCKEIDELISVKKDKIEKLKAYKKSVIYEYVTGKKQV